MTYDTVSQSMERTNGKTTMEQRNNDGGIAATTVNEHQIGNNTVENAHNSTTNTTTITTSAGNNTSAMLSSFPVDKLASLNAKISNSRWVVPVLPSQELDCLLDAAIQLSTLGIDGECEPCVRFYQNELAISFINILTDEAVMSWKNNIHVCIFKSCCKFLLLASLHMERDNQPLLELLAIVFDPENKFHMHNIARQPENMNTPPPPPPPPPAPPATSLANPVTSSTSSSSSSSSSSSLPDSSESSTTTSSTNVPASVSSKQAAQQDEIAMVSYAKPPVETKNPRGWLFNFINQFGVYNGFENFLKRMTVAIEQHQRVSVCDEKMDSGGGGEKCKGKISLQLLHALLRPFGLCAEYLTVDTIERYLLPGCRFVLSVLESLSDAELKREVVFEGKNDFITGIVKFARALLTRVPGQESLLNELEMARLKIILRVLQISSFNGKMNALNEINRVLSYVSIYPHRGLIAEEEGDFLSANRMAMWIRSNRVLAIVLRDSLHQSQYVEKLEKILRFLIKEKALTFDDLDAVWNAQEGKHEAIAKNVHDLLAKLAWDFSADQLDYLFRCFQTSMQKSASRKQRERLLELNRRLAEDDKNGMMAQKVLNMFWNLAHSSDTPLEVLEQALQSHVKILDYSCSQERDAQKGIWLVKCVEELKGRDEWVLPALRLIRDICSLYDTTPNHTPRIQHTMNRQKIIDQLQNDHKLVILVTNSLTCYMNRVRALVAADSTLKPAKLRLDNRYPHPQQIQERLDFLKFLLKDGHLWLCADQAKQIWNSLAVNAAFDSDREECFRWFSKLMGENPDLDPGINRDFFENNLLKLDPILLTENGIRCFERFFRAVNTKEERIVSAKHHHHRSAYVLYNNGEDLIGKDYLWRVITAGQETIANRAISILNEMMTVGPRQLADVKAYHEAFIEECCEKLRAMFQSMEMLLREFPSPKPVQKKGQEKELSAVASSTGLAVSGELSTDRIGEDDDAVGINGDVERKKLLLVDQMCRMIRTLQEYIRECDRKFPGDRFALPLCHAVRGRHVELIVKFQTPGRQLDDIEMMSHSNETMHSFKRSLLRRIKVLKANEIRVDLYDNGTNELVMVPDEQQTLAFYGIRDKMSLIAKLTPVSSGLMAAGSPDSSSESSSGSPPRNYVDPIKQSYHQQQHGHHFAHQQQASMMQQQQHHPIYLHGQNAAVSAQAYQQQHHHARHFLQSGSETEDTLPGVVISQKPHYTNFFLQVYQLANTLEHDRLRDGVRSLLHLLPLDRLTVGNLYEVFNTSQGAIEDVRKVAMDAYMTAAGSGGDLDRVGPGGVAKESEAELKAVMDAAELESLETFKSLFLTPPPVQILYNLEVLEAMLLPASVNPLPAPAHQTNTATATNTNSNVKDFGGMGPDVTVGDNGAALGSVLEFQYAWFNCGAADFIVGLLSEETFLAGADRHTKRASYRCIMRLVKFYFLTVGYLVPPPTFYDQMRQYEQFQTQLRRYTLLHNMLRGGLRYENTLNGFAKRLASYVLQLDIRPGMVDSQDLVSSLYRGEWTFPTVRTIKAIMEVALRVSKDWEPVSWDSLKERAFNTRFGSVDGSGGGGADQTSGNDVADGESKDASGENTAEEISVTSKRRYSTSSIGSNCSSGSDSSSSSCCNSSSSNSAGLGVAMQQQHHPQQQQQHVHQQQHHHNHHRDHDLQLVGIVDRTQDYEVLHVALEVMGLSLTLHSDAVKALNKEDGLWDSFLGSLLLLNPSAKMRTLAREQLLAMLSGEVSEELLQSIVGVLYNIWRKVNHRTETCADYLQLFAQLLQSKERNDAVATPIDVEELLQTEVKWLYWVRDNVVEHGKTLVHEDILEGHLCLTRSLVFHMKPVEKRRLNALLMDLVKEFVFNASFQYIYYRHRKEIHFQLPPPVCRTPRTISAAMDLIVALSHNSVELTTTISMMLNDMFFEDIEPVREWEYLPPDAPRALHGFCGLKNAGATCYMNSVLQQLYMVPALRNGIVRIHQAVIDHKEDFNEDPDGQSLLGIQKDDDGGKNYHIGILKYVMVIFCYLGHSALQYYVPRGLWRHFKLQGEPVNLREQQDAVEFFMSLFESIDEGLKALNCEQLMAATLGGCFSDQKICQDCPHRYSKDEPFSVLSVDIRNHSSLTDSLEQYVRGEILEGADAYHCDKCDEKVVTVKRLCVSKLPPVLAIQLKRFEYDYERVCAIKYNDYFEFPRVLDMEPYTVSGLAKLEGEVINVEPKQEEQGSTRYQLTGIVVHSGQASGGHYYSYILHKNYANGQKKWYKFDDGEVSECKMDDDEEMKTQCFGGDYMGEVYDNNLKRMQYRRQKRWWNAYMLFYTRNDVYYAKPPKNAFWWRLNSGPQSSHNRAQAKSTVESLSLAQSEHYYFNMEPNVERCIRIQNIRYLHSRMLFSTEFFTFMKKLTEFPIKPKNKVPVWLLLKGLEDVCLLKVRLASKFLFHTGFKTKKTIRGQVMDWYEIFRVQLEGFVFIRKWFAENVLLDSPGRLCEYLLAAPLPEIRSCFAKLIVSFCHYSAEDEPVACFEGSNLCEQVLIAVLGLLKSDVPEHGKHLPHYFSLFSMYAGLGYREECQLIKLNVPVLFMRVAMDDGTGPTIKYQYPDLSKLHHVVSHLVRSMDVSARCRSAISGTAVLPNKYINDHITRKNTLIPMSEDCIDYLYNRTGYIKRLLEDVHVGEEGFKLLQYCCWENPHFSGIILMELLFQCDYVYWHDMKHYTDLLLHILLIEDSWQGHRIMNALLGVGHDRDGLLEIIRRSKLNYQKRAYQCIKCMVHLFSKSPVALNKLHTDAALAKQWTLAIEWLQEELEKHRTTGNSQYNYNSWSPPAQSNDNTNGFLLEKSQSVRDILQMAFDLCPEEIQDAETMDHHHPVVCQEGGVIRAGDDAGTGTIQGTVNEVEKTQQVSPVVSVMVSTAGTNVMPAHPTISSSTAGGSEVVVPYGEGHNGQNVEPIGDSGDPGRSSTMSPNVKQLVGVISSIDINYDNYLDQQTKVTKPPVSVGNNASQPQSALTTPVSTASPSTQSAAPQAVTAQTTSQNTVNKKDRSGRPGDGQSCTS
ncbi:probable ubiquitin carboxyl-terminal hydrolase FAF [Anopheles maculipalpis]|uniref:probable ubiquitin carboxyl-terminal hydrolase FAF n=1 Tax=Anopheles maculipalpis TaxID=1496333 RepID=UPI002159547B|nr:probable ubiquitin carboxyl-terminal hydrolase FAF [Anopheles maculipalpis]